jgi:hypothetical protein
MYSELSIGLLRIRLVSVFKSVREYMSYGILEAVRSLSRCLVTYQVDVMVRAITWEVCSSFLCGKVAIMAVTYVWIAFSNI